MKTVQPSAPRLVRARRRGLALALLWLAAALPEQALGTADVRVIVDVSASMGRTDPDNLRSEAVGLLLRLLPDDGWAGVWTYGQYVNMLVKYGASDALWKETAAIRTGSLESVGQRSNLLEAVDRASWDRHREEGGPAHLVLLTDGRLDVSDDAGVNAARKRHLLSEIAPELADAGFKVHTLALSEQADFGLLRQLAAATGGYHGRIESPEALPRGLLSLLGWVASTTTLDVGDQGTFRVAPGTRELTVLRLGATPGENGVALVGPGGGRLDRQTPRERVRWHLAEGYEMATVDEPTAGVWRFEGSTRGVRVYAYGDLGARYVDLPGTVFPGALHSFELAVTSGGSPVTDGSFLELLEVSARLQGADDDVPLVVERGDSGRFRVNLLDLRGRGDYVLQTRIWGPTFTHRLSLPFVLDNPLSVEVHPAADGLVLWAHVGAAELDQDSVRMAALVKRPPAPAKLFPLERLPAGMWKLNVPGAKGLVEIALDMQGNYLNGRNFSLRAQAIRVVLPVKEVQYANMDLAGRPLLVDEPPEQPKGLPREGLVPRARPPAPAAEPLPSVAVATGSSRLPLWFAGAAAAGNVMLIGALWWLLKRRRQSPGLAPAMERLRMLAGIEPQSDDPETTARGAA